MSINRVNTLFLKTLSSTFARLEYSGDYTKYMVKKARDVSPFPHVIETMNELGLAVPQKGDPMPFTSVVKKQTYPIHLGGSLSYIRMQENKLARNDYKGAVYEPKYKAPHKFPLYGEMLYLGLDLETIYFVAYPQQDGKIKPSANWLVNGSEVNKYLILPWSKSEDFKLWTSGEKSASTFKDANGNNLKDKDGNNIELREYIEVKFENAKIIVNGVDIKNQFFEKVSFYSESELCSMRDAYLEKCEREYERKHKEWELSQK